MRGLRDSASALAERSYFVICLMLGRLLRAARYSRSRIVNENGEPRVRKRRAFHAPVLVWLAGPLVKMLGTGVRVLPQRAWEERERVMYRRLFDAAIRVNQDGTLDLPRLGGETLAAVLENPSLEKASRTKALELSAVALAALHRQGFTHGDAMAENVLVDLDRGVAHWIDFETMHDPSRSAVRQRADDLRALLATCLLRTPFEALAETLHLIMDFYPDTDVRRLVAPSFASTWRRPLTFHLGQAPLSFVYFREIGQLLRERDHPARA